MIVCLCEGVSDRGIRQAVDQGNTTARQITQATGAGSHCGLCRCDIRRLAKAMREGEPDAAGGDGVAILLRR